MDRSNQAATLAARLGFEAGVFSQPSIHHLAYHEIRKRFGLSAQMAVRSIGKAVQCFAANKTKCPHFKRYGAIAYDPHIMSFKGVDKVSLWMLPRGRMVLPLIYGEYQKQRFGQLKGQANLAYQKGKFYLYCTVELPPNAPVDPADFIGVDLGVTNIACTSDGDRYSGAKINSVRLRNRRLRSALQRKQTRAAKRKLKRLSGRERRFAAHTNHCISKQLVADAKRSGRGIAIENLNGIHRNRKAGRKQQEILHSWAFWQLRVFITYKAHMAGVSLVVVSPRNTSRECSTCGSIDKKNRISQSSFRCLACGYVENADINASRVIAGRATCKLAEGDRARISDHAVSHG